MLNPSICANGQEQYEKYRDRVTKKTRYQYDYRHTDGELFSCVKLTLEACRTARDAWLERKYQNAE
jgi:hypothetical protein